MADLIDRQTAIDALDKQFWRSLNIPICKEIRNVAKETIKTLPSAQPERWIPVTERLPEKGSFALVTDFGDVEEAYYDSDGHWWQVWGDRLKNVTAWMPLPEPYREEADNAQLD